MATPFRFHYVEAGANVRPTIVFLHGFLGDSRDWGEVMSHLSTRYHCVAVDLPGHGQTAIQGDQTDATMAEVARDLVQLLSDLNLTAVHLVGYSMGGRLGLYLTVHYPERFHKVVLESASPGLKTEAERRQRRASDDRLARKLLTVPLKEFLSDWYDQPLFATLKAKPVLLRRLLEARSDAGPSGLAASLRLLGTGAQPSLWGDLGQITSEALLLSGENDRKFRALATAMSALVPSAEAVVVPGAGHNVHTERPREFSSLIQGFFGKE